MPEALETSSDEQLANEAQRGSCASFELLVRRYQSRLLRFLLRSLRQADAEDVLQDAFVQAYQNLHRYSDRWRFKTWLFVIGQRLMIDHLRRAKRHVAIGDDDARSHFDHELALEMTERRERLWAMAKRVLDDQAYRAVWLHYVEDMGTRDIAAVLGRSWVWVKTSLHRSRRKLAPHLVEMESPAPRALRAKTGEPCHTTA
jgi:RNA polymerase sigma-70 factor (ECF subfamily)